MMTVDNNGELFCDLFSNDELLRHQTLLLLAQDVPACLNGLLNIDLATQKERSELLSYLESCTPVSQKLSERPSQESGNPVVYVPQSEISQPT